MRAPSPTFLSELAIYRQKLALDNQGHHQLPLALKILDRWLEHPSTEAIWQTLEGKLPPEAMPTAEEFIFLILDRRFLAEKFQNVVDGIPTFENKTRVRRRRQERDKKYFELAHEAALLGDVIEGRRRLLGREGTAAIRARFMAEWSAKFRELCNQPLDDVVRVLTEIAFGRMVSLDAVRAAQKRHGSKTVYWPPKTAPQ
jgi:hypothetical protein